MAGLDRAYVLMAELIGASNRFGHLIADRQALIATDQIMFGIIISLTGIVSDLAFKLASRAMLAWAAL